MKTTLPKDTLLELMALSDGELEGADRERVEKLVAESVEAKAFVQNLETLGATIRLAGDPEPVITLDGIADTVLARVDREERRAHTQKRIVVDLAALGEVRAGNARAQGGVRRGSRWKAPVAVAVGVLALAASVTMLMRDEKPGATRPQNPPPLATQPVPQPPKENVLAVLSEGVDVETVDAPQAVSVFYVPAMNAVGANASSVVVWIEDEVKP